ncbi:hypothetical protein [Gaiella sp.]|jgi:hypothetical protein|uniref:hypothetical protein n=1 Tax=Gaiella sp. TaxID=2663207 RepID=UPI002BB0ECAD|nr:hypothetical protein [Gaiella sp.]HWO81106.1 hypothetical protein [Gaiella sp.]
MTRGDRNLATLSPMILTGGMAIVIGALMWGLVGLNFGVAVLVAVLLLAAGILGVWMLEKRRREAA